MPNDYVTLPRDENQARGLGQFAIDFISGTFAGPDEAVLRMVERFHLDSIACAVSALACGTNAPTVLRREALEYTVRASARGMPCFGSTVAVRPEKAVLANCSAVREWDANGTNFGYNPARGDTKGEFGHNDFYPVAVAAAQLAGLDGRRTLAAMILIDEIRGRLAEVFSLKDHKIDHVLHGAIASAAVFAAALGASAEQIESAIGLVVAHYVPFRAIRAGEQLSDSKGAFGRIERGNGRRRALCERCAASSGQPTSSATPRRCFACSRSRNEKETVRSTSCCQPPAAISPSWGCISSWAFMSINRPARSKD